MIELYKKLNVSTFSLIQKELQDFVLKSNYIKESHRHYGVTAEYKNFPNLKEFVDSRSKVDVPWSRFYFTPPNVQWGPHIDGEKSSVNKVCLNIPIMNCLESRTIWNYVEIHNQQTGPWGRLGSTVTVAIDGTNKKYDIIDEICLDQITIMRTDVFHDVINLSKQNTRVNLVVRLDNPKSSLEPAKAFADYFNLEGLC